MSNSSNFQYFPHLQLLPIYSITSLPKISFIFLFGSSFIFFFPTFFPTFPNVPICFPADNSLPFQCKISQSFWLHAPIYLKSRMTGLDKTIYFSFFFLRHVEWGEWMGSILIRQLQNFLCGFKQEEAVNTQVLIFLSPSELNKLSVIYELECSYYKWSQDSDFQTADTLEMTQRLPEVDRVGLADDMTA